MSIGSLESRASTAKSVSKFTEEDYENFNIHIQTSETCIEKRNVDAELSKFIMPDVSFTEVFNFMDIDGITEQQRRFLRRLHDVLTKKGEKFIDDFISTLLTDGGFDDCQNLFCGPGDLQLKVGKRIHTALPDRECRIYVGDDLQEVGWTVVENKTDKGFTKLSELQLAACMIAAMQHNYNLPTQTSKSTRDILGILVSKDKFSFYRCTYNEAYIKSLISGYAIETIVIEKLFFSDPKGKKRAHLSRTASKNLISSLNIVDPVSRNRILEYLSYFKDYAINFDPDTKEEV
ncbi:hypothetical protein CONCODRAFT_70918 [Conidiobolus coronatus NRRL 28638]|uniref:Uncharacterized protein n=1 Tax=Conidiobolus coronatus (strain ATCC 28846 / CBS 209.66 / NRRL 28638) TaxID=796925 RepID=A0A137P5B7_CONC2|nr:hypothetical protein CONCODRAFT_70918 [Conidiobolus coronatus NRRL 28638]|eukprot:KXN70124.1 hypothetical protein CONCODRAFT_70918 [Conidiobolus coronatus NRRL 28638]